jgi:hypothetical protein
MLDRGGREAMPQIVLTDEQAKIFATAAEPVLIRDAGGKLLGFLPPPWSDADIEEAKRRLASPGPRRTTAEVLERLRSLGEP